MWTPAAFLPPWPKKLSALPRVSGSGRDPDKVYISQAADKVLSAAAREAKAMKDDYISVEHVFLGLLDEQTQNTTELFRAFSITKDKFLQQLTAVRGNQRVTNDNPGGDLQRPAEVWSGSGRPCPQAEAGPRHRP